MRQYFILLFMAISMAGCRTVADKGALKSGPSVSGRPVPQGGAFFVNNCDKGGHTGPVIGKGWAFDLREGCYLNCRSKEAAIQDFLRQLKWHRVYGDVELLTQRDALGGQMARFYHEKLRMRGLKAHSFAKLERKDVFDGSAWQRAGIEPGDLFLNMNFGQPNHAGIFYSKRGIAHARLVVEVTPTSITTFDGGWKKFSTMSQVGSQVVWLRPRRELLQPGDIEKIKRWAKTLEPLEYDNTLVDDLKEYREILHRQIDQGASPLAAREAAMSFAKANGKAPLGWEESFSFSPPTGLYCSEGAAAIFSYLGFRQYGENILDQLTVYSSDGSLPDWTIYEDALSGFGADSDRDIYMMHKLFYAYFRAFDEGRRAGVVVIPGITDAKSLSFAAAAKANFKAVERDSGAADHFATQLAAMSQALKANPHKGAMQADLDQLQAGLQQSVQALNAKAGVKMNLTQALYQMFYANNIYGPHSFLENAKHFDLKGVFYNTDLKGKGQALYIADWWLDSLGQGRQSANVSTTLFRIMDDKTLPEDRCIVGESAPVMTTE